MTDRDKILNELIQSAEDSSPASERKYLVQFILFNLLAVTGALCVGWGILVSEAWPAAFGVTIYTVSTLQIARLTYKERK